MIAKAALVKKAAIVALAVSRRNGSCLKVGNRSFRSMNRLTSTLALGVAGVSFLVAICSANAQTADAAPQLTELPEGPGKALVQQSCTSCHGVELLTAQHRSADDWSDVVNRMIANGASLTDDQHNAVLAYLGTYLGKGAAPGAAAAPNTGGQATPQQAATGGN